MSQDERSLCELRDEWMSVWPDALAVWSRFVQLHEPTWCFTSDEAARERLVGSFAMIRLVDHSIVISLSQIDELGLRHFAREILAHEIGHHVFCPGDLTDNARLLARIRYGLPGKEAYAPMVSNLYSDLLINDRLQRLKDLDIVGVYTAIQTEDHDRLWTLYMRIYELLWKLPTSSLARGSLDARLQQDAQLGARLIRSYARDWLSGGGRFAALCLPYITEDDQNKPKRCWVLWGDAQHAGQGGVPNGLIEMDGNEIDGAIHPAEDPNLSGIDDLLDESNGVLGRVPGEWSGRKTIKNYRQPFDYAELLRAAGVDLSPRDLTARYYREMATPHLIPFPVKRLPPATDPLPEGLDVWDIDAPLDKLDWIQTLLTNPQWIPGVTTRERLYGESPGTEPEMRPFDLYLGIDCSGSMGDPAHHLSYPVLAAAIMALSALRAGAHVKVVLSGEPGSSISTDGFIRNQSEILRVLASYLGTGYSFGIHRLAETFPMPKNATRPVHILIVSDNDLFQMLRETGDGRVGWDVASEAIACCGGGGTYVLQLPSNLMSSPWGTTVTPELQRMRDQGWQTHLVDSMEQLIAFAHAFSRTNFGKP